jgi:cyclopropane-fatty-acyl-phospholipid synthase
MTSLVAPEPEVAGLVTSTSVLATASTDAAVHASLRIFQRLTRAYPSPDFALRFWDGSVWTPDAVAAPRFTVVLRHPGALRRMFLHHSQVELGEAFLAGDFAIEGDFESSFRLADHLTADVSLSDRLWAAGALLSLPSIAPAAQAWHAAGAHGARHSPSRDRETVTYHYNTSNEFFAAWLDSAMVYSCAYFSNPSDDLETAQRRKLDYICRKLRLERGERLLDIGCGWGGLLLHAARHFGVQTVGITLSEPQAELARSRIMAAGLGDACRVDVCDYRKMGGDGTFDAIASVGMVEHVGIARLPEYFAAAWRLLRPGGAFLLHGIGETPASKARRGPSFADHYVFPDSELPGLGSLSDAAEAAGFEVRDVENLREHYVLTLRQWRARLELNREAAVRAAGEGAYELWRLFMAGSAYRFRIGHYLLYQTLLVKPDDGASHLPLTREDWYAARHKVERCL